MYIKHYDDNVHEFTTNTNLHLNNDAKKERAPTESRRHRGKHKRNEYHTKNFNNFHNVCVCENYVGQCPLPNVYSVYRMFQKCDLPLP
jgi:hypothetical protein